jgi:hypothetical protein
VPRNPKIEAILEAWHNLEICAPPDKGDAHCRLNDLLDEVIGDTNFTRNQILDHLFSQFKDFKTQMRKTAKILVAQSSGINPAKQP